MPLLVSLLDLRVCLDDLVQRIAPVDDRPDLPVLDQICEEHQVLGAPATAGSGVRVDVEVDAVLRTYSGSRSPSEPLCRPLACRPHTLYQHPQVRADHGIDPIDLSAVHDLESRGPLRPDDLPESIDGRVEPDPASVPEAVGDRLGHREHADGRARHDLLLDSGEVDRLAHREHLHARVIDTRWPHASRPRDLQAGDPRTQPVVIERGLQAEHGTRG